MQQPPIEILLAHAGLEGPALAALLGQRFLFSQTVSLAQTLSRLEQRRANLLLIDLDLPDASGPPAVARVRRSFPDLPIAAIVDKASEHLCALAERKGAQECWRLAELACMERCERAAYLESRVEAMLSRPARPLGSCRLLLGEHHTERRERLGEWLRATGAQVDRAADGPAALGKALVSQDRGVPYHVVLLNDSLPGLGESPAQVLREAGYRRPIIGLTADETPLVQRSAVDEWLSPPFDRHELLEILRRWAHA